jgi:putative transposase
MTFDPDANHRQSTRLENFDYSSPGAYFVTVCANGRSYLFGEILEDEMKLNEAGEMVKRKWLEMPASFDHLKIDEFVIMPNHVHLILVLSVSQEGEHRVRPYKIGIDPPTNRRGDLYDRPADETIPRVANEYQHPTGTTNGSVGRIIQLFKTVTTGEYIRGVHDLSWPPFEKRLWQRNYFERVIRDERGLQNARTYVLENPLKWHLDVMNSARSIDEGYYGTS